MLTRKRHGRPTPISQPEPPPVVQETDPAHDVGPTSSVVAVADHEPVLVMVPVHGVSPELALTKEPSAPNVTTVRKPASASSRDHVPTSGLD